MKNITHVRLEVLTPVTNNYYILGYDAMQFGRYALLIQRKLLFPSPCLKMEVAGPSQTSVPTYQTTWYHITWDSNLDSKAP